MENGDLPEGGAEDLNGQDELEKALDTFNKANESFVMYEPNYKKVVKIPPPSEECLKALKDAKAEVRP